MKSNSGFTLIELLVVMSIIATLATFIFPNLLGAQDKAKEAAVMSIVYNFRNGVESYFLDKSTFPAGTNITAVDLYNLLKIGEYMKNLPKNPYTGSSYSSGDKSGKITYSYDSSSGTYTLNGYKRDGVTTLVSLNNF